MEDYSCLIEKSKKLRRDVLDLSLETGEAHLGGSFSEIEILVALFEKVLKPEDKFILSKGHSCFPLYALLRERGLNPKIQTHPDLDEKNGIYATTGSLGHGFPIGVGRAMTRKRMQKSGRVYVVMGDGECGEGTTWESALISSHYQLDNLHVIVDRNGLQALDSTERILALGNLEEKFRAFGLDALTIDGHSFEQLIPALSRVSCSLPLITVANTIKGKGVSYMENDPKWHTRLPNPQELKQAYAELR